MALRKWGTVRANSQLVTAGDELARVFNDPALNPLLESLIATQGDYLPPGQRRLVQGYGADAADYVDGYWPGISGGFLTINDATAGHQFLDSSGFLTLDDGSAVADAAIFNPGNVLMVIT